MNPSLLEFVHLVLRWAHLIAGILWVGTSMFFIWLESNLARPEDARPGSEGQLKLVHGGGYWLVEKRRFDPGNVPPDLHWFKWEAYATWISGASLLVLVYYLSAGFLTDPQVSGLTHGQGVAVGLGTLPLAWVVYDGIWRSPLGKNPATAAALSFGLFMATAYALTHLLAGRAAYLHLGAMLGTLMAFNVAMVIIPNQRRLVAAVQRGEPHDVAAGKRGRMRSLHNNYMTLPVVFLMISNHFPSTYGSERSWLVIGVLALAGVAVNHFLNIGHTFKAWRPAAVGTVAVAVGTIALLTGHPMASTADSANGAPGGLVAGKQVSFQEARAVLAQRCAACHSARPTDPAFPSAPLGIRFDSPEQIQLHAARIKARAVDLRTMPLGNKTGMTDEERTLVGRWVTQGAKVR